MKCDIKYACGHEGTVQLFGPGKERERKIWWYENRCDCPECYAKRQSEKMAEEYDEVEMHYGEYKTKYSACKTKQGSYNPDTKTIVVFVPKHIPA